MTDAASSACVRASIVVQNWFALSIFRLVFFLKEAVHGAVASTRRHGRQQGHVLMPHLQTRFGPPYFARPANLDPRWSSSSSTRVGWRYRRCGNRCLQGGARRKPVSPFCLHDARRDGLAILSAYAGCKGFAKPHRVTSAVGVAVVRFVRRGSWMLLRVSDRAYDRRRSRMWLPRAVSRREITPNVPDLLSRRSARGARRSAHHLLIQAILADGSKGRVCSAR